MSSDNYLTVRRHPQEDLWVVSMGFASDDLPECKVAAASSDPRFPDRASALDHALSSYSEYGASEAEWCLDLPADHHVATCPNGKATGWDARDLDGDGRVEVSERWTVLRRAWRSAPVGLRRVLVTAVGGTLVLLGLLLVVLPGPFTAPLVFAGLVVLASEFAWAARLLERGKAGLSKVRRRLRR